MTIQDQIDRETLAGLRWEELAITAEQRGDHRMKRQYTRNAQQAYKRAAAMSKDTDQ